jgi:thiol-disulfide isomerase/thioredoxin
MAWLNTPRSTWIALTVAVVMLAATWYPGLEERFRRHDTRRPVEVGDTVNLHITLPDMQGRDVTLTSFAGKHLLINFYATWCGPCRVEMPDLVKLQAAHPDDLAVIGLLFLDDNLAGVPEMAKTFGITYPLLNANGRDDVDGAFGPVDGLPRSVLINRDGRIAAIFEGATSLEHFERALSAIR